MNDERMMVFVMSYKKYIQSENGKTKEFRYVYTSCNRIRKTFKMCKNNGTSNVIESLEIAVF